MDKTVFDNIIIDVVRKENDETNPASLTDKQCEEILQDNVDKDGFIRDKEKALLKYSEKRSRIPISFITQNEKYYKRFRRIFLLLMLGLSYYLTKKSIDPDSKVIFIDGVFWWYCFIPLLLWFFFFVLNLGKYLLGLLSKLLSNNKVDKDSNYSSSPINPLVELYNLLSQFKWFKRAQERFFNTTADSATADNSIKDSENNIGFDKISEDLINNEYIKCSLLWNWKICVILSLVFGAIVPFFSFTSFKEVDNTHKYGFTANDTIDLSDLISTHVSLIKKTTGKDYDYILQLNKAIQDKLDENVANTQEDSLKKVNDQLNGAAIQDKSDENVTNTQEDSLKKVNDQLNGTAIQNKSDENVTNTQEDSLNIIKDAWRTVSTNYKKTTDKRFNKFCFSYIIVCLITPIIPHLIYLIWYGIWCLHYKNLLAQNNAIRIDDKGNIEDTYQKHVLDDLEGQYKKICRKLIWLQIPEESESGIKLSDLKSYRDKEETYNVFLKDNAAVDEWIKKQNDLSEHPHKRTLVCLCDINHPISLDCIKLLSRLTNTDKYDIRFALVYDKNLKDNYKQDQEAVSQKLDKWKSELDLLEEGFSEKYACVYLMDSQLNESKNWRLLEDSVKNTKDEPDYNLTLDEAFEKILKDITPPEPEPAPEPEPEPEPAPTPEPEPEPQPPVVSVSRELITLAGNFLPIKQLPQPEPQPRCITLVIFNGIEQNDFINKFNEYAGAAKNVEKRLYQKVSDSNIIKDINADQSRNLPVDYRIVLIAKVISRFEAGNQQYLKRIIDQILSQEQNRPLQVFVSATDIESSRDDGYDVESHLDYWGRIVGDLKNNCGSNVEFTFEDKFDYPIAPQNVWTNFCSRAFPEANIQVVELPTQEERKKKFTEAVNAISSACEYAFDHLQDEKACVDQLFQLSKIIYDIYCSKDGIIPAEIVREWKDKIYTAGREVCDAGKAGLDAGKAVCEDIYDKANSFNWKNLLKSVPIKGILIGGSIGALAFIGAVTGGLAVPAALQVIGTGASGVLGSTLGGIIDNWTKKRNQRRNERAKEDPAFKEKPEDEQNRILQVESLILNGLTWTMVYDGQGYPEDEIIETIKQVLQPLELVHIFNKEDIESFLNAAQSRWESRCSIN